MGGARAKESERSCDVTWLLELNAGGRLVSASGAAVTAWRFSAGRGVAAKTQCERTYQHRQPQPPDKFVRNQPDADPMHEFTVTELMPVLASDVRVE